MYKLDEDKALLEIKAKNPKRVLLQLPEGLKKEGFRLARLIEEQARVETIISGEPLWGACDVAVAEAKALNCDLIVIYGHAPFMKVDFPVVYVETKFAKDITPIAMRALKLLKGKNVGLVASVQHIHQLNEVKSLLIEHGKNVVVPDKKGHAYYHGQVLGCEYSGLKIEAKNLDCVLVIGNKFHSLGAALSIDKPVVLVDPANEEVIELEPLKKKIVKQRVFAIDKVKQARKVGVIISTKLGQHFGSFDYVLEKLKKIGKEGALISMNEVTNDKLINLYDIEAFVELACPRIAVDDYSKFSKPVITVREFAYLVGDVAWEDLLEKGFF